MAVRNLLAGGRDCEHEVGRRVARLMALHIVIDGPPGPGGGRFVDVEGALNIHRISRQVRSPGLTAAQQAGDENEMIANVDVGVPRAQAGRTRSAYVGSDEKLAELLGCRGAGDVVERAPTDKRGKGHSDG